LGRWNVHFVYAFFPDFIHGVDQTKDFQAAYFSTTFKKGLKAALLESSLDGVSGCVTSQAIYFHTTKERKETGSEAE
jgi:hypothetical protein